MLPSFVEPRLKFPKGEQKLFMESVFLKSGLDTNGLSKIVGLSPRTIRDWKRGKYHISLKALNLFCNNLNINRPNNIHYMIEEWRKMKLTNSRNGGIEYYKKYGLPGSLESRRRGGYAGLARLRELGLAVPTRKFQTPAHSIELAEFVGIMLGDGNIGRLQISITLNSIVDRDYSIFVADLCNKLFGTFPKIIKKKDCNAFCVYYNGINLVSYLKMLGLKVGNKVKQQVGVPDWINNNQEYKTACLRGLMDTDGGIFIHTYKVGGKSYSYKKICFSNYSLPLLHFVHKTLKELGFSPKIIDHIENKKVWLYNSQEIPQYLEVIGSSNQRLNRYKNGGVG